MPKREAKNRPNGGAKGIQSVEIGFRLLRALVDSGTALPLRQIAEMGGMSASKARMYLVSLIRIGLIAQTESSGLYTIGPYAVELGSMARQRTDLLAETQLAMEELGSTTGALLLLATWGPGGATLLRQMDGVDVLPIDFRMGGHVSLTRTATGHVFLAFLPESLTEPFRRAEVTENQQNSELTFLTDAHLDATVIAIRASGMAAVQDVRLGSGVVMVGYTAIAAPIFDPTGKLRFVLTALHQKRRPKIDLATTRALLRAVTERLSGTDTLPAQAKI